MIKLFGVVITVMMAFTVVAGDRLPPQVEVKPLMQGAHCGSSVMGVEWLQSGKLYQQFAADGSRLLLVSMGQQSSAGYSLALLTEITALVDGQLSIQVAWNSPLQGMMMAQVVTRPCLLLVLPAKDYKRVQIIDQMGKLKMSLSRPGLE
ncbi:MAG: protease complex subunit PrcB family protein [Gammaproteobacteria bacterium]|nr:protease complex subunit PrcB family protein [Gammaproteobacteria bacterium]MCF6230971.1 protease complex subunit PrcB family protein [Gammaproteobacteria bacterium]